MQQRSAAGLYVGVVGATLVVGGIIGFFYNATFTSDESVHDAVFGVLDVNGWHNILHILTGVFGLLAFGAGGETARRYALAFGVAYLTIAAWGFALGDGESILSVLPVNTEDNVLHLVLGLGGLGAATLAAPRLRAPARG